MQQDNSLEKLNDWAKTANGNHLHISFAKSGLQGYYCIGCSKEMQAVKKKNPNHKDYYRHNATNVSKDAADCTFSSEEYRKRLAGHFFARIRAINLPPVYKYPPPNVSGNPNLLSEKGRLEASYVKLNIIFYENDLGEIKWRNKPDGEDLSILLRPDAVFFNHDNHPVLLVLFVKNHKTDAETKSILRRLGINTIQIIIPRASEEEIERKLTSHTIIKWAHNETESNATYIPVQPGNSERIPDIDDEQRKLFEESYACRAAQIKNLIRSIGRCVVSQPYKRTVRQFDLEIERAESAAKSNRSRLDDLERKYEREIKRELEPAEREIETGFADLEQQQIAFEKVFSRLEGRYIAKREGLVEKGKVLAGTISERLDQGAGGEALGTSYEARYESLQRDTERIRNNIENSIDDQECFRRWIELLEVEELDRHEQDKVDESANFEFRKRKIEESRIAIESKISSPEEIETEEDRRIESKFEDLRNAAVKAVSERDISGNTELSKRIGAVLAIRGFLSSYDDRTRTYARYKSYLELVRGGAWKTW